MSIHHDSAGSRYLIFLLILLCILAMAAGTVFFNNSEIARCVLLELRNEVISLLDR